MNRAPRLSALAVGMLTASALTAGAQRVVDTPIRVGQKVSDAIRATDPVANNRHYRLYRFEADSGKRYSVSVHSSAFDAFVRVLRPAGPISEEVGSDDDSGPGNDALLRVRAQSRGPHYVSVETYNDSLGAFELEVAALEDRPLVTKAIPEADLRGRGTLGEQSARNDRDFPMDVWTFRSEAGRSIRAVVTSSSAETYLAIGRWANGRFTMLEEAADAGRAREGLGVATRRDQNRQRASYTVRIPARGDYAVRVMGQSGSTTGSYALRLEDGSQPEVAAEAAAEAGPDRPAPRARAATVGREMAGTLGDASGVADGRRFEEWTVSARAGDRVTIDMKSEEFDTYLLIGRTRGGRFSMLAEDDDGGEGLDARLRFRVPEDGEYVVRAAEVKGESGGAYTLNVATTSASALRTDRTAASAGRALNGTITESDAESDDGRRYDEWTYTAAAGERLTIDMRSSAFDTYLSVGREEDGSFTELAKDDDGGDELNARVQFTAPRAGTYVIRASEVAGESGGAYALTVTSRPPVPRVLNRARLPIGIDTRGTIVESDPENDDGQRYDEWTFTARAGDRITVSMRAEFDTFLFLGRGTGEAFEALEQNDDGGDGTNSRLTFTIPTTGEYTIRASELRGTAGGAYTVTLTTSGAEKS